MSRYLEVAADAQGSLDSLLALVPENKRDEATILAGHIFNYGFRSHPRAANGTCRQNAVSTFLAKTKARVHMEEKVSSTGRYKALQIYFPEKK